MEDKNGESTEKNPSTQITAILLRCFDSALIIFCIILVACCAWVLAYKACQQWNNSKKEVAAEVNKPTLQAESPGGNLGGNEFSIEKKNK